VPLVNTEQLMTTEDLAEYLRKPRSWVHDNQARLDIPRFKVGNQYRYRLSEVAAWVETRRKTMSGAHVG
jgi:excisionase family DNA binding protein